MHFQSLASASTVVAPSIDKQKAFLVFSALFISRKIIPRAVIISFFILFVPLLISCRNSFTFKMVGLCCIAAASVASALVSRKMKNAFECFEYSNRNRSGNASMVVMNLIKAKP